jgi:hypothetical protein
MPLDGVLVFDEAAHVYTLNGRRLPNVTGVLEVLGGYEGVPADVMAAAARRGTYVHKACELHAWGMLDWSSVLAPYLPYVEAFDKFLAESGFEPEYVEERVFHRELLYAGTIDLIGVLPPQVRQRRARRVLIDLKTTFRLMRAVGPQLAAYDSAWRSSRPGDYPEARYGLQLRRDGSYRLEPFASPLDLSVFRACLVVHNFLNEEKS